VPEGGVIFFETDKHANERRRDESESREVPETTVRVSVVFLNKNPSEERAGGQRGTECQRRGAVGETGGSEK
jgi:hypothetical protein